MKEQSLSFFSFVAAVVTRAVFALHCTIAAWRVVEAYGDIRYLWVLMGLSLIIIEAIYSVVWRKGQEYKWFSPCVFVYLLTIIPCIWLLELYRLDVRLQVKAKLGHGANHTTSLSKVQNGTRLFPGVSIPIVIEPNQWIVMIEQFVLFFLIIGRWLLPKGEVTRDELSQLLMVYLGTAADIIEFFEAFKEEEVKYNWTLTITIMAIWSASLLQFTLVVTASKSRKIRGGFQGGDEEPLVEKDELKCCGGFDTEIFGIMTTMFLQDAPFFALRMLLIVRYDVRSYMHLFFTIKNSLVLMILFYRLIVIHLKKGEKNKSEYDELEGTAEVKPDKEL